MSSRTEVGGLRPHDPRAAARAFMGMLVVYVIGREVFVILLNGLSAA